jgi:lichenan operon transcriptional antiterminator
MNDRKRRILRYMLASSSFITSDELAQKVGVTSRTIRNDIKLLNEDLHQYEIDIQSIRGKGYALSVKNQEKFQELMGKVSAEDMIVTPERPESKEERVVYIIKRLLLTHQYIKLEDLAHELYVSRSTVQGDLKEVKKRLEFYNLVFLQKPNYGLKVKGEEVKIRFCMSEYIFNRRSLSKEVNEHLGAIFAEQEISVVRRIMIEEIKKQQIILSDLSLNNLVVHLLISYKRIQAGNYASFYIEEFSSIKESKEYEVATCIVKELEKHFGLPFPQHEILYVALHLLGTKLISHSKEQGVSVKELVNQEMYQLASELLQAIDEELKLDLQHDEELLLGLCLHLKPFLNRHKYGMNLRNPLLAEIKANYPLAFEGGVVAGSVLKSKYNIDSTEEEIGYLALHIGGALERKSMKVRRKRCVIVCASGLGSAKLLEYKLRKEFGHELEIVGTTEYYRLSEMSLHSLDFVISTIPIETASIPVVQVKSILGLEDLNKIEKTIRKSKHQIAQFIREDLIFLNRTFENRKDVIHFLACELEKREIVPSSFFHSVMEREEISATSFGNLVAIPHPIQPYTDSTFWTIVLLDKPIKWGEEFAQFICLLNVEKESNQDLKEMYEFLIEIVNNPHLVKKLLKCKTYKEFMNVLFLCSSHS